jgi:hypothetical protein
MRADAPTSAASRLPATGGSGIAMRGIVKRFGETVANAGIVPVPGPPGTPESLVTV